MTLVLIDDEEKDELQIVLIPLCGGYSQFLKCKEAVLPLPRLITGRETELLKTLISIVT